MPGSEQREAVAGDTDVYCLHRLTVLINDTGTSHPSPLPCAYRMTVVASGAM